MKYELREGVFGRYTLYVEEKFFVQIDPWDMAEYRRMRKATKEERRIFSKMMNNRRVCRVS